MFWSESQPLPIPSHDSLTLFGFSDETLSPRPVTHATDRASRVSEHSIVSSSNELSEKGLVIAHD